MDFFAFVAEGAGAAVEFSPAAGAAELRMLLAAAVASLLVWIYVLVRWRTGNSVCPYEGRRPVPWRGSDVVVVLVLWLLARELALAALVKLSGVDLSGGGDLPAEAIVPALVGESLGEIGSLVLAIGYLIVRAGAGPTALGFGVSRLRRDLELGLIGCAFIVPPVLALNALLSLIWEPFHPVIDMVLKDPPALRAATVLVVFVAPLVEEFVFRVVLQGWLETIDRAWWRGRWRRRLPAGTLPVLTSSLLFALLHIGQGPAPIPLFFLALVLGYLYHQTHRIWPGLIVHAGLNGLTAAMLWLALDGG